MLPIHVIECLKKAVLPPSQRRQISQNIKRLKDIQCYRGKRHIMVSGSSEGELWICLSGKCDFVLV